MRLRLTAGLLMLAAISVQPALAAAATHEVAVRIGVELLRMTDGAPQRGDAKVARGETRDLAPLLRLLLGPVDCGLATSVSLPLPRATCSFVHCHGRPGTVSNLQRVIATRGP
jgi:hypothetical protein